MDWKKAQAEHKDERRRDPVTPDIERADFPELEDETDRQEEQSEQSDSLRPIRFNERPSKSRGEWARQA